MSNLEPREFIQRASEDEIKNKIRERLSLELRSRIGEDHIRYADLSKDHLRFDMSGTGRLQHNDCYFHNLEILKLFVDYGIWDFVNFLYLDAYKGTVTLYWKWWNNNDNDEELHEESFGGFTTTEIIYNVVKILSIEPRNNGKYRARRYF